MQDWDDAPGAIDWPRFAKFLEGVKDRGILLEHHSHDHLNEQKEVPVAKELSERWKSKFVRIQAEHASRGERVVWALVDGFLLYWDTRVVDMMDVPIFLRVPREILRQRREERSLSANRSRRFILARSSWVLGTSCLPRVHARTR